MAVRGVWSMAAPASLSTAALVVSSSAVVQALLSMTGSVMRSLVEALAMSTESSAIQELSDQVAATSASADTVQMEPAMVAAPPQALRSDPATTVLVTHYSARTCARHQRGVLRQRR